MNIKNTKYHGLAPPLAFSKYGGKIFDACAGPHLGTRTEAQYISDTVDSSPAGGAEAILAGDTTDVKAGAVNNLK